MIARRTCPVYVVRSNFVDKLQLARTTGRLGNLNIFSYDKIERCVFTDSRGDVAAQLDDFIVQRKGAIPYKMIVWSSTRISSTYVEYIRSCDYRVNIACARILFQ